MIKNIGTQHVLFSDMLQAIATCLRKVKQPGILATNDDASGGCALALNGDFRIPRTERRV